MKQEFIPFNQSADLNVTDTTQRGKIIALAVAHALANLAALPSSAVESPASHFNLQVAPEARSMISLWNENAVFDAKACLEYMRSFWMLRYAAVHPITRPLYSAENCSFFEATMGVGMYVPTELQPYLNQYKNQILFLSTSAAEVIFAMREQQHG